MYGRRLKAISSRGGYKAKSHNKALIVKKIIFNKIAFEELASTLAEPQGLNLRRKSIKRAYCLMKIKEPHDRHSVLICWECLPIWVWRIFVRGANFKCFCSLPAAISFLLDNNPEMPSSVVGC